MRYIALFAAIMALLTTHARVRGAEFVVVNNCPKFTVVNNITAARGGAAAGPKSTGSPTTGATPARNAATPVPQGPERGSSAGTPQAATSTNAIPATLGGFTSGCANGQCASPATSQRRGLIFWR